MILHEYNFKFEPHLNLARIAQRKLRRFLSRLIYVLLIVFGLYGLVVAYCRVCGRLDIFYLSAIGDLFLFYLWRRFKERIKKIKLPEKGEKIEIYDYLDNNVKLSFEKAWLLAFQKKHQYVQPLHLFLAFLKNKSFNKILNRLDCHLDKVTEKANNLLEISIAKNSDFNYSPLISPELEKVLLDAYVLCLKQLESWKNDQITSLDILWAMAQSTVSKKNLIQMVFDEFGISPEEIEKSAIWAKLEKDILKWEEYFAWRRMLKPPGKLNKAMTSASTPTLNRISEDYTSWAKRGRFEIILGREKTLDEVFNFWTSGRTGVLLVGPAGVGKKSVVQRLAQLMVEENVPKFIQDKRLVKLDLGSLLGMGGAREKGEEYLKNITYEIKKAGNIVLFIEDIDNLIGLKAQAGGLDFAEIIATAIDNKDFFLVATCTTNAFSTKIENGVLGRVLSAIEIKVPDKYMLTKILAAKVFPIERELGIIYSVDALNQAIELADRYLYGQALTAKAADLLEEVGSLVKAEKGSGGLVKDQDVAKLVSKKTDVPLTQVLDVEKKKLLNLEKIIHEGLINQEKAVEVVADALRRGRLHLREDKRPIANLLFVGPTGVGKTELAKTLARVYFGSEKRMIRLDMSEYQEQRSIRNIIGVRTESELTKGFLTESIKRQPFALLLLDELEKAHPDVLNVFLQLMDDGRLTDASGETINFSNIILIATSNAGTKDIQDLMKQGRSYESIQKDLKEKILLQYFRPEFLNRFDSIVLFKSLTLENMIEITKLYISKVKVRLTERGIEFEVEPEALKELAIAGFDPFYGARPLQRLIQERIDDALATMFLEDKIKRRDKVVLKKGEQFEIIKAPKI